MRSYLALLGLALAACSSNSTTPAERPDNLGKPATTPLGTTADKATPATRPVAPAPATAEVPAPTTLPTWPAPFKAAATGCSRVATRAATILARPVAGANKFGQLAVGDKVSLLARTADGWVGFDPGSAQAGNVGILRLRWVRASEAFGPGAKCPPLPLVQAPPLGCLLMAARATPVHPRPAPGTARLSTIPAGSYAQVVTAAVGPGKWAEVLVPGTIIHGYVAQGDLSFSGNCQ